MNAYRERLRWWLEGLMANPFVAVLLMSPVAVPFIFGDSHCGFFLLVVGPLIGVFLPPCFPLEE